MSKKLGIYVFFIGCKCDYKMEALQ
jgi:hypothetical protein